MSVKVWERFSAVAVEKWKRSDTPDDPVALAKIMFLLFLAHERARHVTDIQEIDIDLMKGAGDAGLSFNNLKEVGCGFGRFEI